MTTEQTIQPLNVAAATLLFQLLFVTVIAIASSLHSFPRESPVTQTKTLPKSPVLFVALASFALLLISDEFYSIWSPIFQGVGINTVSASKAIGFAFFLDMLLIGYLMLQTGGSRSSPFTSALFTLPAIAIFLRLPPFQFLLFTGVAAAIYLALLIQPTTESYRVDLERRQPSQSAAAFINIACLLLSIFTGYITRPVPITELPPAKHTITSPLPSRLIG